MKAIAILSSPTGERFFEAYGPMSKHTCMATVFDSKDIAAKAVSHRFGTSAEAFWNSEKDTQAHSLRNHIGWTAAFIELADGEWFENRDGLRRLTYEAAQRQTKLVD